MRDRWRSRLNLALIMATTLSISIEYSLLMPTVWQYLRMELHATSKLWLGATVSAFSLTRTLFFTAVGIWADMRGFREPYIVCSAVGVLGGVCYGLAGKIGGGNLCLVIIGRLLAGAGAARSTLASTYIARTVVPSGRTSWLGIVTGVQLLGNLLGPALNAGFILLDKSNVHLGIFELNSNTAAGYVPAVCNVLLMLCFSLLFNDRLAVQKKPLLKQDELCAAGIIDIEPYAGPINAIHQQSPQLAPQSLLWQAAQQAAQQVPQQVHPQSAQDYADGVQYVVACPRGEAALSQLEPSGEIHCGIPEPTRLVGSPVDGAINCSVVPLTAGTITALVTPDESSDRTEERSGGGSNHAGSEESASVGCWGRHHSTFFERGGWFILLVNFISGFEISGLETTVTPLTQQYQWHTMENSVLFAGIAGVALLAVLVTSLAPRCDANNPHHERVRPRRLIIAGFVSYGAAFTVGFAKCTPAHFEKQWMMVFGALFVFGIPLTMSPAMAIYSSKINDEHKGELIGIANLVQGVGRIAGPLMASAALHLGDDTGHWPLFLTLGLVYAVAPLSIGCVWSKLELDPDS
uniref:Major facilitator superfamily (MFS) profile domain-containing protein n=1 Tax=Haptolina ericina TaxID=156174 RepID=A0A7S3B3U9_9EUKA